MLYSCCAVVYCVGCWGSKSGGVEVVGSFAWLYASIYSRTQPEVSKSDFAWTLTLANGVFTLQMLGSNVDSHGILWCLVLDMQGR